MKKPLTGGVNVASLNVLWRTQVEVVTVTTNAGWSPARSFICELLALDLIYFQHVPDLPHYLSGAWGNRDPPRRGQTGIVQK